MSYDLNFKKGKDKFSNFLKRNGARVEEDGTIVSPESSINVSFWITGNSLQFNYVRNLMNVDFVFKWIQEAFRNGIKFEIEDAQSGKVYKKSSLFSKANFISNEDVRSAKASYLKINQSLYERMIKESGKYTNQAGPSVPVESKELELISKDIAYQKTMNENSAAELLGYIPTPFMLVNIEEQTYKKWVVWTEFIDQLFTLDYSIEYVQILLNAEDEKKREFLLVKWTDLQKILPEPKKITFEGREWLFYSGLGDNLENLSEKVRKLEKVDIKKEGYLVDMKLSSFFSVEKLLK